MKIIVILKQVPDLVEDLEIAASGIALDFEMLKMKLNEFDDHALEEALLIKEELGGAGDGDGGVELVAMAIDGAETDKMLFTALAKGADRAIKVAGPEPSADSSALAADLAGPCRHEEADLILTGVQSASDREGPLGPLLAVRLGIPSVSVVTGVAVAAGKVNFKKEYAGGLMAEFEADLPIVLGIQAARQPPRYAPVSKVRQIQQSAQLETATGEGGAALSQVLGMEPPPKGTGAHMLADADALLDVLKEKGVV